MKYLVGQWIFDINSETLVNDDKVAKPGKKALQLLHYMLENRDSAVTRYELIDQIFSGDHLNGEAALNGAVSVLSNILNVADSNIDAIQISQYKAYRLVLPVVQMNEKMAKRTAFLPGLFRHIAQSRLRFLTA
jgi:DNA-binding winged helix-turn-helix (wHTH) protein